MRERPFTPHRPWTVRLFGTVPGLRWLVGGIVAVVAICAALARLLAPHDFPSFGIAAWWAVQTVTTVGYGDIVPQNTAGRLVASVLMIAAIAFVSILTASIAAGFVHRLQSERGLDERKEIATALEQLDRRLEAIERKLS